MKKKVLITAALPYSNGRPHVGHLAGCYLPADIYVRYLRAKGTDVRFICGSDDHGVAIQMTADQEGKTPAEVAQHYRAIQEQDFRSIGIEFDIFSGTSSSPYHISRSQAFFKTLYDKGFFNKKRTKQFYDATRDMFLPDRYVKGTCGYCATPDQNSDQCENCGKILDVEHLKDARSTVSGQPVEVRETVHWFLDLSRFETDVANWIEHSTLREHTRSYVKGLLATGLIERSMTRDINWGVPLPLEDPEAQGKVLYVWFDAPIGYVSFTEELCAIKDGDSEAYSQWWKSDDCDFFHFIGEDNTIFHCIIWIAMLQAEGSFKMPKGVIVNQFLNIQFPGLEVEKISKSRGTAIWLGDFIAEGGNPDSLRYYLTSIAPERARTAYNPADLLQKHNSDLANTLGNFVNRIISFTHKYIGEEMPAYEANKASDLDRIFSNNLAKVVENSTKQLDKLQFKSALEAIMEFCRECNRYVDAKEPWKTRKEDMVSTCITLGQALNAIFTLGVLLQPFLPFTAKKILSAFDIDQELIAWSRALDFPSAGSKLIKPEILFAKIEDSQSAS